MMFRETVILPCECGEGVIKVLYEDDEYDYISLEHVTGLPGWRERFKMIRDGLFGRPDTGCVVFLSPDSVKQLREYLQERSPG